MFTRIFIRMCPVSCKVSFSNDNKQSQGQIWKGADIDQQTNCFSQGQLYAVVSRISSSENLYVLFPNETTRNVVYSEELKKYMYKKAIENVFCIAIFLIFEEWINKWTNKELFISSQ